MATAAWPDDLPESWLLVYDACDSCVRVRLDDHAEARLDAAVTQYMDSHYTRDSLIDLTTVYGQRYRVRASHITGWAISTPESRENEQRFDEALKATQRPE